MEGLWVGFIKLSDRQTADQVHNVLCPAYYLLHRLLVGSRTPWELSTSSGECLSGCFTQSLVQLHTKYIRPQEWCDIIWYDMIDGSSSIMKVIGRGREESQYIPILHQMMLIVTITIAQPHHGHRWVWHGHPMYQVLPVEVPSWWQDCTCSMSSAMNVNISKICMYIVSF